jgi:LPS O-antigen subunit length determinant protein (WzzB/FepE family)
MVQQETPVFKTLQQPVVPYKKSGPKRVIGILLTMFLGAILSMIVILFKKERYKSVLTYS